MEPEVVKTERRGRKRKRKDGQGADTPAKKATVETRAKVFVGRYVKKEFDVSGVFLGKIVSYDTGLYRIDYEDGDFEDLETSEVKSIIVGDKEMDDAFHKRKKVLDEYVLKKYAKDEVIHSDVTANKIETVRSDSCGVSNGVELASADKDENSIRGGAFELSGAQTEVDGDSSSDLSDYEQPSNLVEVELPLVPPPQLPPSSGNIGVSEEHVPYLLSVYSFLRSFSVCLFLSPFGLDEFVGALNSSVPNTLLDAVHVALMRALKSHVETLSSEGSEHASKCLRSMDWSLLDSLTWPVLIVQYLMTMRYAEGSEWKEFYANVLEKNYNTLSAGRKLIILQLLCDDALNSVELRSEMDMREGSEIGPDPDGAFVISDESILRTPSSPANSFVVKATGSYTGATVDEDGNVDECRLCGMDGMLLCCDGCPSAYHPRCIGVAKMLIPEGAWFCPDCTIKKTGPNVNRVTSLRGAALFGIDPYEQVYLGSCDHLLVMKTSRSSEQHVRYYSPVDIQKVLHALTYSAEHRTLYLEICKGILQYWEIPEHVGIDEMLPNKMDGDVATPTLLANGSSYPTDVIDAGNVNGFAGNVAGNGNKKSNMNNTPGHGILADGCLYMGLSFKPHAYLNAYIHGDFAASAAASLAILSSEEKLASQPQSSSSHRKILSANYSLHTKAFSLAAKRFYWPIYEKKLVEVPRERCGWCLTCQASVNSRKGCLLNAAASNAIKGASKILASMRQSKNVESSLASIATYVLFMEESLCGLTTGPFLTACYRNQWRKELEEAATLTEIKASLLEFERHIRGIAFSTDWTRLVDDMGFENEVTQSAKSVVGPTQKRGPGRPAKRGRKPSMISEIPDADADADGKDLATNFAWWRGGMLSKHLFQKGLLPQMMIKHAARQGGSGKINGVQYVDGFVVPKRSRQFLWRAAVEMCKTASQLALQVRYLDLHVRWSELVCPEQPLQDGKGPETEASVFRNACIVDKKVLGTKISYGVVFEKQKHLPSRVLKNVLQVEETGDGKEKKWFVEMRIPLYLIKEYERKLILPTADKHVGALSSLQKKHIKSTGKNIFSFLSLKMDNQGKCLCTLCQLDVPFRIAAMCSACQGYCHVQCAVGSKVQIEERVEFLFTCKRCYNEKYVTTQTEIVGDSPTSPLLLQGQESQQVKQNGYETALEYLNQSSTAYHPNTSKSGKKKKSHGKRLPLESVDQRPTTNDSNKGSNKSSKKSGSISSKLCLGLVWKKKNPGDTGIDFRLNNLLLKDNPNGHMLAPECHLCTQPYNSNLMYIRCEKCAKWYHADSVELKESKIRDLMGFKCSRCRRIRIPICPHTDPETRKKLEAKKKPPLLKNQKQKNLESDSNSETNFESDATPIFDPEENANVQEDDSLYSFPKLEVDFEPVSGHGPGPKKLPVRRHIKSEKESDGSSGNDLAFDLPATFVGNVPNHAGESSTPVVEWDVSTNGYGDDMMFDYTDLNYDDMEFEPQTYFSFNELLASDDNVQPDRGDPQGNVIENMFNPCAAPTQDCNPDQYQMDVGYDQQEPMFSVESSLDMMPCRVCSQTEPCPDLYCQTCGLWIHQYCSPWDEDSSWEPDTGWTCGNCRGWR